MTTQASSEQSPDQSPDQSQDPQQGRRTQQRSPRSFAEWVTFGISALMLSGITGLILYSAATSQQSETPEVTVQTQEAIARDSQFYVPFEVKNQGGKTVESVQVMAELQVGNAPPETGTQEIDFLSQGEAATGAFVFQQDPRNGELTVRISGYRLP